MRLIGISLTLVLAAGAAWAQGADRDRNWRVCNNASPRLDYELVARSCTAIIASPNEAAQDLVVALVNRGVARARQGRSDQALEDFERAVKTDPTYGPAFNARGTAYAELGRVDDALRDYDRAIEIEPDDPDAHYGRGNIRFMKRDLRGAIADYDRALAGSPNNIGAINNRAAANEDLGEPERAIADYTRLVELSPRDAGAFFNRGKLRFYDGKFSEAAADLDHGADIEPSNPYYALWAHFALARDGHPEQSRLAQRGREADPTQWPATLVRHLLGLASAEDVAAAIRQGDAAAARERATEADFYLGQQALVAGNKTEAERRFRAVIDSGLADFIEYRGARAELGR